MSIQVDATCIQLLFLLCLSKTIIVLLDLHSTGLGHSVLRIGGGLTPCVQVPDTHAHRPYNNHYRNLEKEAAGPSWAARPGTLLDCSRQTVLTRSVDAWNLVDHNKNAEGWKHNGITNPLNGDGDAVLGSQVIGYWDELQMDSIRAQLIQDVIDAVESGEITDFWDYPSMLIPYDDHPPLVEGLEGASTYIYDESGAHAPCVFGDDDQEDGEAGEAAIAAEEDAFDDLALAAMPGASISSSSSSSSSSSVSPSHAAGGVLQAETVAPVNGGLLPETLPADDVAPVDGGLQPDSEDSSTSSPAVNGSAVAPVDGGLQPVIAVADPTDKKRADASINYSGNNVAVFISFPKTP
jgi:hypothetical protein